MNGHFTLLWQLGQIDSPSGDEGSMCDFLEEELLERTEALNNVRIGDSLIVWRGKPKVALLAHIDTTGFTLGYDQDLIPLGSPDAKSGDYIRQVGMAGAGHTAGKFSSRAYKLSGSKDVQPGSRWVFDRRLTLSDGVISGPYLDNRAGVWAAIQALAVCSDVAVAFTVREESSGHGALVCAQYLYSQLSIAKALISDITWHTKHVRRGHGPAISLRDRYAPRQRFLDKVLETAEQSGVVFQREIVSDGGSDGSYLLKSHIPIDWVFVGAPEEDAHSSNEKLDVSDLVGMAKLLEYIVKAL